MEIVGQKLLDGGIADAVPFAFMERSGYGRNVIVLTQPQGYRKQPAKGLWLYRLLLKKYPRLIEAMRVRHEMYNREMEEIDRREREGSALVIRPPRSLGIGHTEKNPEELERVYRIGKAEAEGRIGEIKRFLATED